MPDFLTSIIDELANPKSANFWAVWLFAIGGIFSFIKWLGNSRAAKIERILTFALVDDYETWVKARSKSQQFDIDTLGEWLSSGKIALLGHDYSVFKNFMKRMQKNGRAISIPDEDWFLASSEQYKSAPKWSRVEW
ncbi:MAG: hypothetical protein FWG81_00105 [Betaproteobacteria bacterium]|nr:hypothetical protein [Betaproteobacteria bacterium]